MKCTNCQKSHNGQFTMVMGIFKICKRCETTGTQAYNAFKPGIVVESVDRKTGKLVKKTFRGQ